MRLLLGVLAGAVALGSACEAKPPPVARGALGGEVVARVGTEEVAVETVRQIASAQSVSPQTALDLAVADALFAADARSRAPSWKQDKAEARVLGRLLLSRLFAEAKDQGPPTDAEVEEKTNKYWVRVARPAAAVVGNAVVLVPEAADEQTWLRAERVAKRIVDAVAPAAKPLVRAEGTYDFEQSVLTEPTGGLSEVLRLAKEVDGEGLKVVAEASAPFAADNLTVTKLKAERQPYEPAFVAAAINLKPGELAPPFRTRFGVHVVVGVLQVPAEQLSLDVRRTRFADEIYSDRTRALTNALLTGLRAEHRVEVDRAAETSLSEIKVER
ncbi:MAG: peptidylprolyl isomerase [Myxococcales bacterium]|nr:peptidylprolyl isomerase [Myxococcales bacterium]